MKPKQKDLVNYFSYCDKWNFKPQISSIFHFDRVSEGEMAHILGVKYKPLNLISSKLALNMKQCDGQVRIEFTRSGLWSILRKFKEYIGCF